MACVDTPHRFFRDTVWRILIDGELGVNIDMLICADCNMMQMPDDEGDDYLSSQYRGVVQAPDGRWEAILYSPTIIDLVSED